MPKRKARANAIGPDNYYVEKATHTWRIRETGDVYCLIKNEGQGDEYLVRVLPYDESIESYWLNNGQTWESEAGAACSVLNDLSE
jgi:hypothetical protein